jgi:hypothetical protein
MNKFFKNLSLHQAVGIITIITGIIAIPDELYRWTKESLVDSPSKIEQIYYPWFTLALLALSLFACLWIYEKLGILFKKAACQLTGKDSYAELILGAGLAVTILTVIGSIAASKLSGNSYSNSVDTLFFFSYTIWVINERKLSESAKKKAEITA